MEKEQRNVLIRIIVSAVSLIALLIIPINNEILRLVCFLVPYLIIGYDVLWEAVEGIFKGELLDENFLMTVATIGAIVIAFTRSGSYTEAVFVMLFYKVGELFEDIAVDKSRSSITALMDIRPDSANLKTDDGIKTVSPDTVEVGSLTVVSAGEKIALDGVVVEGSTSLNTSALTGESIPRDVSVGDEVFSGSVNLSSTITVKTTKPFGASTASKILDLVENAAQKKAKSEQFITRFARVYTPVVCALALMIAVIPPVVLMLTSKDAQWSEWIYRALTFLVISCPCALVISIPLSFFGGIGAASRKGVLVKGSAYLENLSKTKTVVFDKTGTLTKGEFTVNEIIPANGFTDDELLRYAAYTEAYSSHPISKSLKSAYGKDIDESVISSVKEHSGKGVTADIDGKSVAAGNLGLMEIAGADANAVDTAKTVVYVAVDGVYAGCITISDTLKDGAKEAIDLLKKQGVTNTVMLSGDKVEVAKEIAAEIGINSAYGGLLPQDKVETVEQLLQQKSKNEMLAFVGDGINDAPVLTRADLGIAMGALGSDAAIEAADIVLMDDDPRSISKAITISKKCLRIVYENIGFAIGVKVLCLLLGALGIANMWLAIFADVGVMVLAVLNAIRCLKIRNSEFGIRN